MPDEQSETPCHHGWRGTRIAEQIADRCPSCGGKTLFIGSGGWLTCSYLRCSEPGVGRAIEKLRAENDELRKLHPIETLHEDDGDVLIWRVPIDEAPEVTHLCDTEHEEKVAAKGATHWSRIPVVSAADGG